MRKIVSVFFLAAATFAVYGPALRNDFVWDDNALVLRDPLIRSWRLIPESFQHFLFVDATASDFYRPMQRLSYTLDYALSAFQPIGYHFTSVLCHAAAAIALYFLALELLAYFGKTGRGHRWVSLGVALAWAVHPLQSSAVAYIAGRADPLAAAFGFFALWLGLRSLRAGGVGSWAFLFAGGCSFLCAGLSKESGLIFPLLWMTLLALGKNWRPLARAGVVTLFVAVIYLTLRLPAEHISAPAPKQPAPLLVRPILMARAFAEYTCLFVWPVHLQMERDVETHPSGFGEASLTAAAWRELQTLAGVALIAAFLYWLMRERKRDPAVFGCLLLTLLCYLPVSGIIPLNATLAEHWLYLPSAFLLLALGLSAARLMDTHRFALRTILIGGTAGWILFCAGRTFIRTFDWKDQRTFFERTIASGGDSVRMLINLGGLELSEGNLSAAKKHLDAALAREPKQPFAVINRATVAVRENDFPRAHELLQSATGMPLVEAQAYELMAVLENKEFGRANPLRLRLAARSGPPNWIIEKRYVSFLAESGAVDAAIAELRHCLVTQWYRADSWLLLAALEAKAGNRAGAQAALARARSYDVHLGDELPKL